MCEACESDGPYELRKALPPEILSAARTIEAVQAGEPASDEGWAISAAYAVGVVR
jgi:hypothetical protein